MLDLGADLGQLGLRGGQLRAGRRERRPALEELPLPFLVPLGLRELGTDLGHL